MHHEIAADWLAVLNPQAQLYFCRFTQIGLLRLLSTPAVLRDGAMSQVAAWNVYDAWTRDGRVEMHEEPPALESRFRLHSRQRQPARKDWADSYLLAFAEAAGLSLVTFDAQLRKRSKSVWLLGKDR